MASCNLQQRDARSFSDFTLLFLRIEGKFNKAIKNPFLFCLTRKLNMPWT